MLQFKYRSIATALMLCMPLMACGEAIDSDQEAVYFNEVTPDTLDEGKRQTISNLNKLLNSVDWTKRDYPHQTVTGNYLAGRFAASQDDLQSADKFMFKALELDPNNPYLVQRTFPSSLGAGNIENALSLAPKTLDGNPVIAHLGSSLLIADAFKNSDYEAAQAHLEQLQTGSFGHYLKPITQAWIFAAQGKNEQAIETMAQEIKKYPSLKALYFMHMGMVFEHQGNDDEAVKYYNRSLDEHFSARTAWLVGELYERTGQADKALETYQELQNNYPQTTFTSLALARVGRGELNNQWRKATPSDGVMSGLFDLASVLDQERSSRLALLYGQVAHYLVPEDPFLKMLMGDMQFEAGNFDDASQFYSSIEAKSDFFVMSQTRLAKVYEQENELDKAISILEKLSKNEHVSQNVLMTLGDLLRRNEQFKEAIPHYTKVIDGLEGQYTNEHWELFYARGVAYEQADDWPKAEMDLQQALELEPNQPYVLNYLGYSWADQGVNIELALEYIQKAVELRPNDGYIIDSMGWVLYQLGRYEEAVLFLEEAVAQVPGDPIINDHLGDAYWQVGRRLEAGFQWQRALDNADDEEMSLAIEMKLIEGLSEPSNMADAKTVATQAISGMTKEQVE